MNKPYTIADYLFNRVHEAGATEVFGVPGDFNLTFLDNIVNSEKLRWVGNMNELNAGYAADGYARERGFAALVTTFGVGELSTVNATAGSFAEYAPVLHIVGAPSVEMQKRQLPIHHSLGDGEFNHFMKMIEPVTVARARITPTNAASEIDRVIKQILHESRPGFILLAPDVARTPIYPPTSSLSLSEQTTMSKAARDNFRAELVEFLKNKPTTILADLIVHRLGLKDKLKQLIDKTDVPYATLVWGKSLIDEHDARWAGTYAGAASKPRVKAAVEKADCLIQIGVQFTDTTSAGFTHEIKSENVIDIKRESASIADKVFAPIPMSESLDVLIEVVSSHVDLIPMSLMDMDAQDSLSGNSDKPLKQEDLWKIIAGGLDENNLVFAEQGTSYYGISEMQLPKGVVIYGQPMWGSIGYTLPALLGGGLASRSRRPVLLIGDGSALLTIQELAVMFREALNPVIFLINNDGYSVERAIHGECQPYNDIPRCDWQTMPKAFGATEENCLILQADTPTLLKEVINQASSHQNKMVFIEVIVGKFDYPPLLTQIANALKNASSE